MSLGPWPAPASAYSACCTFSCSPRDQCPLCSGCSYVTSSVASMDKAEDFCISLYSSTSGGAHGTWSTYGSLVVSFFHVLLTSLGGGRIRAEVAAGGRGQGKVQYTLATAPSNQSASVCPRVSYAWLCMYLVLHLNRWKIKLMV